MTVGGGGQRRPGAPELLAWLLVLAAAALLIVRTPFVADLTGFLPAHPDARQRVLVEQLKNGAPARMLMFAIEGGDAAARAEASRGFAAALRASGLYEQVQNGDLSGWQESGRWLVEHRYLLSPAVDAARYTAPGLRDAIEETLSLLGTPAGAAVKPLLERDPTGEVARIAESLLPATAPRSEGGVWVARQTPRALLLATTRGAGSDLVGQAEVLERTRAAFAPWAARGLKLLASGPPVYAVDSRARIEGEAKQLAAVGAAVIGTLLLLAFASVKALAVGALPVATGIVVGIAAVALSFGQVHAMTLGFGSTLIGETVDYAIYYLIQARGASEAGSGWRRWRDDNWPTVRLGLATSVCGFAALVFSGFPGLAQLGVFSIAGLIAAALATRHVLPAWVPDGAPGIGLRRQMARIAGAVVHAMPRLRLVWLGLAVAAAAMLLLKPTPLWRGDLASLSPVPASAQRLDAELRADLGGSDARTLVVAQGASREEALRAAEAAGTRLDALVADGRLAGYDTPARLLPSLATQRARSAALPEPDALRAALAEATAGGPLPADRLAPFLADVERARTAPPLDRAALDGTAFAPLVDALLVPGDGGWSALIALQPPAAGIEAAAVRAALAGIDRVQVIDIKDEIDRLYAGYLRDAFVFALLGAAAVVALLALHLRSLHRLANVCQPLAAAVLLILGALAALDVALGILHLVGLLLVVAVGSNYALFFDQLRTQRRLDDDTLASLLLANVTTVISFGLIALSHIPALSAIGAVVAPGALLALLLSAAFGRDRRPAEI